MIDRAAHVRRDAIAQRQMLFRATNTTILSSCKRRPWASGPAAAAQRRRFA
jgi:hypothetical protein